MPKLLLPVSADPIKLLGKDYICHQGVIRKMLLNLENMEYPIDSNNSSDDELRYRFFVQTEKIVNVLSNYYSDIGKDAYVYLTAQMLKSAIPQGVCVIDSMRVTINNYDSPIRSSLFYPKPLISAINKCSSEIVLVQLLLNNTRQELHANLLVIGNGNCWRLEPNAGTTWDQYDPVVDSKLVIFCKDLKIKYRYAFPGMCPIWVNKIPRWLAQMIPVYPGPPMKYLKHGGLCMFLAVAKFIYSNRLNNTILKEFIVNFFKGELKFICV